MINSQTQLLELTMSMPNKNQPLISASEAILQATQIAMQKDDKVFVMGEGVCDPKAIVNTTKGLIEEFGMERVIEMPTAENGLTGVAIGASICGQKPILIHQRIEFALLAMEQIINNAAKMHYVTNGVYHVPLVMRMIVGRGWGQGPQHSQTLETLFAHIPGLKVAIPATARDAKGMMLSAIEDPNPVLFIEHRWFHYVTGYVPEGYFLEPLQGCKILKKGKDITLIASSYSVYEALLASEICEKHNIQVEVIDLRMLRPLDLSVAQESIKKTGRLIFMDTGWKKYGASAEIITSLIETNFSDFKIAPIREGLPDHPTPSSKALSAHYYPTAENLICHISNALQVSVEKQKAMIDDLYFKKPDLEADVPNSLFKGPF